jgi:hypothetical protein
LNLIVDKTLKGQNAEETNSILESFFAGCKEYDLYELAALYNTIPLTELQQIQVILNQTTDTTTIEEMISQTTPESPVVQEQPEPGSPGGSDEVAPPQNPVVLDPVNCEVSCYFRNDYPKPDETVQPFNTYLQVYIGKKQAYVNCAPSAQKQGVENFFDYVIGENLKNLDDLCDQIFELCNQNYNVTITLIGNTSKIGNIEYNTELSKRRISSVQQYIERYKDSQLSKFKNSTLKYISNPEGETNSNSTETGPLSDTVCALQAIENRNVSVQLVAEPTAVEPTPETVAVSETPQTDEVPNLIDVQNGTISPQSIPRTVTTTTTETRQVSALPGLAKKVLRNLLSECSYFEMMKEDSPVIYDSLKEKLKYFHPAFHAITPEGLNSRLTFLNQCTRPGSTIPVINDRGQEVINDAENTSFGAPPICVLRIGDFYNTKIVMNSISLAYENLDINPEGIGIQPMIANVTINFDFIGGSGLKEPINQLQNALSFNYYANTEMYDERAEATEDTSEIDNKLYAQIQENQRVQTQGNLSQQNNGGTYIGSVVSTEINDTGFTGTLSYETIINDTKDKVRNYVFALTNNLQAFAVERGWGFMTEMNRLNRFYENGVFNLENVQIYGSPQNIQGKVDTIFTTTKGYFDNDEGYILEWISETPLKTKTKRTIKKNLIDFINNKKNFVSGNSVLKFNEVNTNQVDMVKNINKLNYITQQTSDGFIDNKGNPTIVTVSLPTIATDSPFKEIVTLSEDLNNFLLTDLQGVGIFDASPNFEASPNIEESPEKYYYEYLTLYEDIVELDFRVKLVNTLLTNVDSDQESSARVYLNEIIDMMYEEYGYQSEQKYTETKFKEAFDKINDKFEVYNPFQSSTGFAFGIVQNISPNSTQIDELKNLYDGVNSGSNDTFNGKENFV